jgi:phenylalanyl-tRNA synthetase alpha chain
MKETFNALEKEFLQALKKVSDRALLDKLKIEFLGRKGKLAGLMKNMASLSDEERREVGKAANETKKAMEAALLALENKQKEKERKEALETEWIDVTQPVMGACAGGTIHPVTRIQQELEDLFASMGFIVADGPELESDFYNFTALNIPPTHPARDMQDTFYIEGQENVVMRTHTSPVQIRTMRKYGTPLRMIAPGRCFRNEATDVRHEHTFHQLEGLVVDKGIHMGHMKGVLEIVGKYLYGPETKIRLRPKFYPFVEPGVNGEVTCFICKGEGCRLCKKTGWLEVFGAGMVHPNVLKEGGIDPEVYSGFAFGFGLTRLVMLKYGIDDIRHLESGDLRFLKQF